MKIDIIRIGNSRGVRIPAAILKECRFNGVAEATLMHGGLFLKPVAVKKKKPARQGWEEALKNATPAEDDPALRDFLEAPHPWDEEK